MITPPEHDAREAVLNARFERWSTAAAVIVTTMGTSVLVGWVLGIEVLKRVLPGLRAMNPATAASLILCGFSLALLRESRLTLRRRLSAQLLAFIVVLIGLANVAGVVSGSGFAVDHVMPWLREAFDVHDEMATSTAIGLILFGMALVYFAGESKLSHRLSQLFSTAGTVLALVPFVAYLYGADMERGFGALVPMALHSAFSFLVLGTGLLIAPGTQAIKLVSRADQGGKIVREFFPLVVVTIIALGFLRIFGQRMGWYGTEMGAALMVSASIVALGGLLWGNATIISNADRQRLAVEEALKVSESALRAANEALALQVRTDSLTGVRNRMALDEELSRAMLNLHRYETEIFSVLMLDVDNFKQFNDTFGHLAGDEVLKTVAQLLETTCRATDIVGRYGGEEFVVLLPHTIEAGAREIAERLRVAVERHDWADAPITVSIGIATASSLSIDADEVLHEADTALYHAKQSGRNRVSYALPSPIAAEV